jgi:serine/threonine protein kinase
MPANRIELSPELKKALLDPENLPGRITVKAQDYFPKATVKAAFKAAVWKVLDEHGRARAAKLAIYEDYEDRSFLQELYRAAKLERFPQFAKFIGAGLIELSFPEVGKKRFVCIIEEWIDGLTLEEFLTQNRDVVDSDFLLACVNQMCCALHALQAKNLRHDDLHSKNVMLARPDPDALDGAWMLKVIDTGSLKPGDPPTKKEKDDHRNFIDHLVSVVNTIQARKLIPIVERRFIKESIELLNSMLDEDPSIALRSPNQILSHFKLAYTRACAPPRSTETPGLTLPFEYISAEHIADDRVLVDIFAQSCPWLEKVASRDPCLVTGPRGCGKSTIFRWLSLRAHLHKPASEIGEFPIAGFYISSSTDLQNRMSWIRTEAVAQRFGKEIVHYFNLLLAREILHTLWLISDHPDRETFWGLGKVQEQTIHGFILQNLQVTKPLLQGVSRLRQCIEVVEAEMFRCHVQMLRGQNLEFSTPETFLGDFTELLVKNVAFFASRPIGFLVDDFSAHRLAEPVQKVLNRVIWERRSSHIFKLSSEKYGTAMSDVFGATVDLTREMVEIDCGREYVALDDFNQKQKARRFAKDLLKNRLVAAGYAGAPERLLGKSEWAEGSLGRALRERHPGRKDDQYHGLECIADLCSGDVSTLLLVYRRIFEKGNVNKTTIDPVPMKTQHEAIESVSRELIDAIKAHFPYGPQMHRIVAEFGHLVGIVLREGKMLKKGTDRVPPECPRIEVDQDIAGPQETLTEEQQDLARELIRRAAFIEMEPGRSRHKFLPTLRWQLRRVYLPHFGAALTKNDAVKWIPSDFKFFLTNPKEACDREWERRQKETDDTQTRLPYGQDEHQ